MHLSRNILFKIGTYCTPIEFMTFTSNYNNRERLFKTVLCRKLNSRLCEIFGKDFEQFKKLLAKNNGVISGSFILQCILGVMWIGSDIDIYVPIKDLTEFDWDDQFVRYKDYKNRFTDLEVFLIQRVSDTASDDISADIMSHTFHTFGYDGNFRKSITNIRFKKQGFFYESDFESWDNDEFEDGANVITCNNIPNVSVVTPDEITYKTIQIIRIDIKQKYNNVYNFICDSFDFDICKNVFYYDKNGKPDVCIYNLNDILLKKTELKTSSTPTSNGIMSTVVKRYAKYKGRGFTFYGDMDSLLLKYVDSVVFSDKNRPRHYLFNLKKKETQVEKYPCGFNYKVMYGDMSVLEQVLCIHKSNNCGYPRYFDIVKPDLVKIFDDSIYQCDEYDDCPAQILMKDQTHFHTKGMCGVDFDMIFMCQ